MLQLAQRVGSDFHLTPLSREEVHAYIDTRLTIAGAKRKVFSDMAIDTIAAFATLFGLATSLGFGAQQANAGLEYVFGIPNSVTVQVILITVITAIALVSVLRGLDGGVKLLSEINMLVAMALWPLASRHFGHAATRLAGRRALAASGGRLVDRAPWRGAAVAAVVGGALLAALGGIWWLALVDAAGDFAPVGLPPSFLGLPPCGRTRGA